MVAHHFGERHARVLPQFEEARALREGCAQREPGRREHARGPERHPPSPGGELRVGEGRRERQHDAVGEQEAERGAHLRKARPQPAPLGRRVLGGQQHRPAPLAAEPEPLEETQHQEKRRSGRTDRRVRGHTADGDRGEARQEQRDDEDGAPPVPVTDVPEEDGAERPGHKAHSECREGGESSRQRRERRKEQRPEHQRRGRPVDEEVVELDGGTGERGGREPRQRGSPGRGVAFVHAASTTRCDGRLRGRTEAWRDPSVR